MISLCTLVLPAVSNDGTEAAGEVVLVFLGLLVCAACAWVAFALFVRSIRWLGRQWRGQ